MVFAEPPTIDDAGLLRRAMRPMVLLGAILLVWASAGNHPLHAPDEGRYGTASASLLESSSWLVPTFRGAPHLTKPPLIYWLQAASMGALGKSEFALRLPSLAAATLSLLLLGWFVRRVRGPDMAVIAVGLFGVMPLPLLFGRLATTDAVLHLCWLAGLACAALAVEARRTGRGPALGWLALAWGAVAIAALDKGPVAPAPMVIVAVWLALGRRWSELRWFGAHALWGAALALLPITAWAWAVVDRHPEALRVWREQFIDRALFGAPAQALVDGAASDPDRGTAEPIWFYLPIFLAGFFPATAALTLPWFNLRWREALRAFTQADLRALLLVAVVGPLLFFSIARGKMPSYIIPVGAPLAILVAGTLARAAGMRGAGAALRDEPIEILRPPDVRFTFFAVVFLAVVGGVVAGVLLGGEFGAVAVMPLGLAPMAALVVVMLWNRGDAERRAGLVVAWCTLALALGYLAWVEDRVLTERDMGARAMVERVRADTASPRPQFVVYAFRNPTIDFYSGRDPLMVWSVGDLRAVWPKLEPAHAILLPRPTFEWIVREYPRLAEVLVPLGGEREEDGEADGAGRALWNRWPGKPTVILRMTGQAEMDDPEPPTPRSPEPHE